MEALFGDLLMLNLALTRVFPLTYEVCQSAVEKCNRKTVGNTIKWSG